MNLILAYPETWQTSFSKFHANCELSTQYKYHTVASLQAKTIVTRVRIF